MPYLYRKPKHIWRTWSGHRRPRLAKSRSLTLFQMLIEDHLIKGR